MVRPDQATGGDVRSVLMCLPAGIVGGGTWVVLDLADELARRGISVHVAYVGARDIAVGRVGLPHERRLGRADAVALADYVLEQRLQLVHGHLRPSRLAALAAAVAMVPSLRTIHGRLDRPGMLTWRERISFLISTRLLGQRVVAVSPEAASDVEAHYGLRPGVDLFTVPNGYPVDEVPEGQARPSDGVVLFVYSGRFEASKGFAELVGAFGRLREEEEMVKLTLLGDGPLRDLVDPALVRAGAVELSPGWVPRETVLRTLRRSHVFVLPSWSEGVSIALLEAMAHELVPLVADAASGGAVVDGTNGLVYRATSEDALLEKMRWIVARRHLLPTLAERARATVAERFSLTAMADRYLAVYRQLLTGPADR